MSKPIVPIGNGQRTREKKGELISSHAVGKTEKKNNGRRMFEEKKIKKRGTRILCLQPNDIKRKTSGRHEKKVDVPKREKSLNALKSNQIPFLLTEN